jgi:sugar phosphate isomerase/epimerase
LSIADAPPFELIHAAARAGFDSVGLRITGRRPEDAFAQPIIANPAAIKELRRALAQSSIRLSNVSAYHLYPGIGLEHLLPVVETSALLGAGTIVAVSYDQDRNRAADLLGRYCEAAAAAGLKVALETVSYSALNTLHKAYGVVRSVNLPNFGLLLDPLHLARAGDTPAGIGQIDPCKIIYAQLCDASPNKPDGVDAATEARTMRLYPGEGGLPLGEFLSALPAGVEIEVEVPARRDRHLDADQRAKILYEKASAYLSDVGSAG